MRRTEEAIPPPFAPANVLVTPLWVVTPDGNPALRVGEDGALELFKPGEYEPHIRIGPVELTEMTGHGLKQFPAVGIQIMAPGERAKAILCMEQGEEGRLLLFGAPELPAMDLSAHQDGSGSLCIYSPLSEYPGAIGVELNTRSGRGKGIFSDHTKEDGHDPTILRGSVEIGGEA
jgi:hypothetical protein